MNIYIYLHIHIHIHIHVNIHIHVYVYICIYIHEHIYIVYTYYSYHLLSPYIHQYLVAAQTPAILSGQHLWTRTLRRSWPQNSARAGRAQAAGPWAGRAGWTGTYPLLLGLPHHIRYMFTYPLVIFNIAMFLEFIRTTSKWMIWW